MSRLIYLIWWATSDCGRSILRWAFLTFLIAIAFGVIYHFVALDLGSYQSSFSPYYFSFVTLTTLGYGDVVPASPVAQVVATIEVIVGYIMLGGMLSLFANGMVRRAE